MGGRERLMLAVLAATLAASAFALAELMEMRVEGGDVYPEYSSHRADPMGASALLDTLAAMPGLSAGRNYRPLGRLGEGEGETLMVLGAQPRWLTTMGERDANGLERFVGGGGRLVVTLGPGAGRWWSSSRPSESESRPASEPATRPGGDGNGLAESLAPKKVDLAGRWEIGWSRHEVREGPQMATPASGEPNMGPAVTWRGALYLDDLGPAWRTVWEFRGRPAVVERRLGGGTIVVATDTYFASNEALRKERRPRLLAWLVGPARRVTFDETHLGVEEEPGVMVMARRYGLSWVFAALGVLAGLFVWRSATSLAPRAGKQREELTVRVEGRDSWTGLVNLLSRSVPPGKLLRACYEEWAKRLPAERRDLATKAARMRAIVEGEESLPKRKRDPVRAYRAMAAVLAEEKIRHRGAEGQR